MKRTLIFVIILSTSIFARAQNSKFSLGLAGSAEYYKYQTRNLAALKVSPTAISAFHAGIRAEYKLTEKIRIISGLYYSMNKYRINAIQLGPEGQFSNPALTSNAIEIPMMLGYTIFTKGNFKIVPSAGIVVSNSSIVFGQYLLEENSIISDSKTYIDYRSSVQINIIFKYHIFNKIFLTFEPLFNYEFYKTENFQLNTNTSYLGVLLSVNYKF